MIGHALQIHIARLRRMRSVSEGYIDALLADERRIMSEVRLSQFELMTKCMLFPIIDPEEKAEAA